MDIGMPRWRNGRARTPMPIVHLSADRLGDMVDAVRSNPPDLATLPRPQAAFLEAPPVEFSPPPPPPAYEPPPAPAAEPAAVEPPAEIAPDYTWDDAVPPPVLAGEDSTPMAFEIPPSDFDIPLRDFEILDVPEPALAPRVEKRSNRGRHRRPPSLKHFGRGLARTMRSALVTPRVVALVAIIGALVVATALLALS